MLALVDSSCHFDFSVSAVSVSAFSFDVGVRPPPLLKANRECTLIDSIVRRILNFKHARLEWERLVLTNEARLDKEQRIL